MNIHFPKFTSSDNELNVTYNYRCELYQRHVKETPDGCVVTEFLPNVGWAGKHNTINCPAMHHIRDGRWLHETNVMTDYIKFWCTAGSPRSYSFPLSDSTSELEKVTGDNRISAEMYSDLVKIYYAWDDHKKPNGMFTQLCDRDGMEYSISGDGFRTTLNSYMYADGLALAKFAKRNGNNEDAENFENEAHTLCDKINSELWNDDIGMYVTRSEKNGIQNVRELVGYIPWIYGIPTEGRDACFSNLLDENCFLAKYGLRTADASHPEYNKHFNHECLWNGPVWPFATAQTLTAVIEYINSTEHPVIDADGFMKLLLQYAYSHRDTDGTPWLDENMDPDTGIWLAREIMRKANRSDSERGQHYNHSSFIDLVMTGICGIRPSDDNILVVRPLGTSLDSFKAEDIRYHGHSVDVCWNKDEGLTVTLDGDKTYFCKAGDNVKLEIVLE